MGDLKTGYKVCDAMTEQPITISPNTTLQQCAKIMKEEHVGSLIIKENSKVMGILTEQDIVRKSVINNDLPSNKKVKDILETNVISINPERDIFEALTMMRDYNIRHLPVIDEDKLIGFITLKDILKIEPDLFELMLEKFEIREETRKPTRSSRERSGNCEVCGEYSDELKFFEGNTACPECRG